MLTFVRFVISFLLKNTLYIALNMDIILLTHFLIYSSLWYRSRLKYCRSFTFFTCFFCFIQYFHNFELVFIGTPYFLMFLLDLSILFYNSDKLSGTSAYNNSFMYAGLSLLYPNFCYLYFLFWTLSIIFMKSIELSTCPLLSFILHLHLLVIHSMFSRRCFLLCWLDFYWPFLMLEFTIFHLFRRVSLRPLLPHIYFYCPICMFSVFLSSINIAYFPFSLFCFSLYCLPKCVLIVFISLLLWF